MNKSIKSDCQAQKHTDVDHTQCIQSHTGIQALYNVYIYVYLQYMQSYNAFVYWASFSE